MRVILSLLSSRSSVSLTRLIRSRRAVSAPPSSLSLNSPEVAFSSSRFSSRSSPRSSSWAAYFRYPVRSSTMSMRVGRSCLAWSSLRPAIMSRKPVRARTARGWSEPRPPPDSTPSMAANIETPWARAESASFAMVRWPMPRVGKLTTRAKLTSSSGLAMRRRYPTTSFTSWRW